MAGDKAAAATTPNKNLPATQGAEKKTAPIVAFKEYLDERMAELQFALPSHISPDRFQRVALTALQRKPDLLNCTKASLWNACLLAAQDGLMPDGREGAIVPYGENADGQKKANIATWMPMIEGLRKKARNSGEILNWEAHTVRQRDHFEVILGDAPRIDHRPYIGAEDPGPFIAAYSIAWLKDDAISRDVMTIRDLLKIKAKSKAQKNGPWGDATFEGEMMKKTVARRHYKQLPHSSDLDRIMQRDDEAFGLDDRDERQIADRQAVRLGSTAATFERFAGAGSQAFIEQQPDDQTGDDDDAARRAEADRAFEQDQPQEDKTGGAAGGSDKTKNAAAEGDGKTAGGASDGDVRRWPNGEVPKEADEYEHYAETKIADFTKGPDVSAWWKSKDEADLRKACGVSKDLFDSLQAKAQNRYSELLAAAKK